MNGLKLHSPETGTKHSKFLSNHSPIARRLNEILADEYGLFVKTLNYHWNLEGPGFSSLHPFLESQYKALLEMMDSLAERIRILGERPIGTIQEAAALNDVEENPHQFPPSYQMLESLLDGHTLIVDKIKNLAHPTNKMLQDDPGTVDFLVGMIKDHEQMSWMLRAHLTH